MVPAMRIPLPAVFAFVLTAGMVVPGRAQNLSTLAESPDYRRLDGYQETITREEFSGLLERLYAPHGGSQAFIRIDPDAAVIRKTSIPLDDLYTLRFAPNQAAKKPLPTAYWRPRAALPKAGQGGLDGIKSRARPRTPGRALGQAGGTLVPDRRRATDHGGRDDAPRRPAPG